jgi:aerobic-type carbon monoxide dehydrogenase small subunit (CoxS/CutS family)
MTYAVQADGAEVGTVEGLSEDGTLNALQRAFSEQGALQCGFCTAGVLISTTYFLVENPNPDEQEVREMLSGHLCRCTGYEGMVRAILSVAGGPS